MIFKKSIEISDAKRGFVDKMLLRYSETLLGTPPKKTASGKLTGATPPNMSLLSKMIL